MWCEASLLEVKDAFNHRSYRAHDIALFNKRVCKQLFNQQNLFFNTVAFNVTVKVSHFKEIIAYTWVLLFVVCDQLSSLKTMFAYKSME